MQEAYREDATSWLTLFLGGRADKNTYSHWLWASRAVIILLPNDRDSLELRYEGLLGENLFVALSGFWQHLNAIGINNRGSQVSLD